MYSPFFLKVEHRRDKDGDVFVAWRYTGLRIWHLVLTALFGFFLAATGAAPDIRHMVSTVIQLLSHH